jgi:hypothetical protein
MAELSPAAKAIDFAIYGPGLEATRRDIAAAALRAAVDQVIPMKKEPAEPPGYGVGYEPAEYVQDWTRWHVRTQLLAIAAELEGSTTNQKD